MWHLRESGWRLNGILKRSERKAVWRNLDGLFVGLGRKCGQGEAERIKWEMNKVLEKN